MLSRIFPAQIDNQHRGHPLALWLFGLVLVLRTVMGGNSILNARSVMTGAEGIALDRFDPALAQTTVSLFMLLALSQLVLALLGWVVLLRYRAMVPLMLLTLLVYQLASRALVLMVSAPQPGGHAPGFWINIGLLAVLALGFLLSLWRRGQAEH